MSRGFEVRHRKRRGRARLELFAAAGRVDVHLVGGGDLPTPVVGCVLKEVLQPEVVPLELGGGMFKFNSSLNVDTELSINNSRDQESNQ
jgi:hypothetical protein